jgi:hypothetical protein
MDVPIVKQTMRTIGMCLLDVKWQNKYGARLICGIRTGAATGLSDIYFSFYAGYLIGFAATSQRFCAVYGNGKTIKGGDVQKETNTGQTSGYATMEF